MTLHYQHPHGLDPPKEWFQPGRRVTTAELQEWLAMKPGDKPKARWGKFNANVGPREDLGFTLRSSLEANTARLLLFLGYQRWVEKGTQPPDTGRWFRYEGEEFLLTTKRKKVIGYKPDFHVWGDGRRRLWECKGCMDARSKRALELMKQQHPELPVELITREELEARKAQAMYEARRRGWKGHEITGWE